MSVGDRIAQMREELSLSQTELANKSGLKPPTISQYESGSRSPSYEALIKLSNALNVTTDYLITGKEIMVGTITDPITKILLHLLQWLPEEKKDMLLDYAIFLSRGSNLVDAPALNDAVDYANLYIKKLKGILPIDVDQIANQLGVKIIEDDLGIEHEGLLIKGEQNIILLNNLISNRQRKKFTTAMLLGHLIIPWHVKTQYSVRKSDSSTLLTTDIEEIEAQQFAAALIMPRIHLERDFSKNTVTLDTLKKLSAEKYDVSLFSLCNRLVDHKKDEHAIIQSKNGIILKTHPGNRILKDSVHPKCKAASFSQNPPDHEETRHGEVPSDYWFEDGRPGEEVFEESIFNPAIGKVLTLLTLHEKEE